MRSLTSPVAGQSFGKDGIKNAAVMMHGHHRFLERSTGETIDPKIQHYTINLGGVLANNRHFIATTQQEAQPNGDGTTEGQSVLILGYCHAYIATKQPEYLEAAKYYWQAYVDHFYAGQPVPDTPQRWICNWIVNAKEPVLANYPIDPVAPTHSGFKGSLMTFVNGRTMIPHDAPHWGQYLDKATFAYVGHLTWDAINASVVGVDANDDPVWSENGVTYPMDWLITWTGQKIDWDGNVLSEGHPVEEHGTVVLKDLSINGVYKFNYATRNPLSAGGYLIKTNEVQHNRPLHVPLLGSANQMGNAADAEEWFADACHVLYKITGDDLYRRALESVAFTLYEYSTIDALDKYFRQSIYADTPFTDGISYDYSYPSGVPVRYGRDTAGYMTIAVDQALQLTLEQQAIWFRITKDTMFRTTFGGIGATGTPVLARVDISIKNSKSDPDSSAVVWSTAFPATQTVAPVQVDLPLGHFTRELDDNGQPFIVADLRYVTDYGGSVISTAFEDAILGDRVGTVISALFPDDDAGLTVDFWARENEVEVIESITYKSDAEFDLRIIDANGWRWYWVLPNTAGVWTQFVCDPADLVLSGWQPNHPDDPDPAGPVYTTVDGFTIIPENSSDKNIRFTYYAVNELATQFNADDGYTMLYRLSITATEAFTATVGDCTAIAPRDDSLAFTPGVIPYSNIYNEGSAQIDAWHGMPYPGYQYPFIYCIHPDERARELSNMIDFQLASQEWYTEKFGVVGPGASAYIWNRWDNLKYGTPDTFTMYHFGDGKAWSGYQPRAMMGACRAWYELWHLGKPVPENLRLYSERWLTWLIKYTKDNNGMTPTDFPMESLPVPLDDDFTGHMAGLWLSGACLAAMAGCALPGLDEFIETTYREIQDNYKVTDIPGHAMNGSWSPALRLNNDNGMFFGFWAGEILRGLGLYITYKTHGVGANIYL